MIPTDLIVFLSVLVLLFYLLSKMLSWAKKKLNEDPPVLRPERFISVLLLFSPLLPHHRHTNSLNLSFFSLGKWIFLGLCLRVRRHGRIRQPFGRAEKVLTQKRRRQIATIGP